MVGRDFFIGGAGGAVVGGLQGYCLRSFVDTKYRIEALGDFGQPSVLAGLGGGIALALGLAGLQGKGPLRGETATGAATFYGVTALATAIWSLLFPVKKGGQTAAAPKAVAARPPVRVVKSEAKAAPKVAEKPQVRISRVGAGAAETAKVAEKKVAKKEEAQFM